MIITYHGKEFFKLQLGDTVVAYNPVSKDSKGRLTRFGADVALSSVNTIECNGFEQVAHGDKKPFEIRGPGEYEVKGVIVRGIFSECLIDKQKYVNTIYTLTLDGIKICLLGMLSGKLDAEQKEEIGEVDILFVPVEGGEGYSFREAASISVALEPKVIIPMNYSEKTLPLFLREAGAEKVAPIEKLTVKRKDIDGKDGEVMLLEEL